MADNTSRQSIGSMVQPNGRGESIPDLKDLR